MTRLVTCPRCDAHWTGLKIEHCTACHATFTSTRAGDKHRVGPHDGERRCLTYGEMSELKRKNGLPYYTIRTNSHGTLLWSEYRPAPHPQVRARHSDDLAARPATTPIRNAAMTDAAEVTP